MKAVRTGYGPDEIPIREGCFVFPDNDQTLPHLIGTKCKTVRRCGLPEAEALYPLRFG